MERKEAIFCNSDIISYDDITPSIMCSKTLEMATKLRCVINIPRYHLYYSDGTKIM